MARINIKQIVEHLNPQMRIALSRAVNEALPDSGADADELWKAFQDGVDKSFNNTEEVPDAFVNK